MHKVALGQVILRVLLLPPCQYHSTIAPHIPFYFPPVSITPPSLHTYSSTFPLSVSLHHRSTHTLLLPHCQYHSTIAPHILFYFPPVSIPPPSLHTYSSSSTCCSYQDKCTFPNVILFRNSGSIE
jgi:hypothetical protein